MKKLLIFALIFISTQAMADVTGEIISVKKDTNGNIEVHTQYKIDGVEVVSNYPQENGKYYWVTRYSVQNFFGMSDVEKQGRIDIDVKTFAESLITKPFIPELIQIVKDANATLIETNLFKQMAGHIVNTKEAKILIDTNFDKVPDTEWVVKTDGTKVETPIP